MTGRARVTAAGIAALLALAAGGCGGDDGEDKGGGATEAKSPEERRQVLERLDARQVAGRVAKLRDLEYRGTPKLRIVTSKQSARHASQQAGSAGNVEEDEELLKLVGILPPT